MNVQYSSFKPFIQDALDQLGMEEDYQRCKEAAAAVRGRSWGRRRWWS